jgi:hypothetical protein
MTTEIARIYVNNIEVGSLPAYVYRKIVGEVRRDKRLYFAQAMNWIWVAIQIALSMLQYAPFTLVVFCIFGLSVGYDAMVDLVKISRTAPPEEVVRFMVTVFASAIAFNAIVLGFGLGSGSLRLGYTNHFDNTINRRVRMLLEVPAEGDLTVLIQSQEDGSLTAV